MARLEYLISQELYPLNVTLVTLQLLLEPLQYQNTYNTQHFYNDGTNVVNKFEDDFWFGTPWGEAKDDATWHSSLLSSFIDVFSCLEFTTLMYLS